jgi:hypothetical protein
MSLMKNEQHYQDVIKDSLEQKMQFIDRVRIAIRKQTPDLKERKYRLDTFDALLLRATYADETALEEGFNQGLPSPDDPTIVYLRKQLREINGFCKKSFSDEHEGYQNIYNTITYLTPEIKASIRQQFSDALIEMIFDKTGTAITNKQVLG